MNPLDTHPKIRKALYVVQWALNGVLGLIGVILTARGESPAWFVIVGLVFNFVWTYTGLTASGNVITGNGYDETADPDYDEATGS